jgi:SAM-dependent methyltransferase
MSMSPNLYNTDLAHIHIDGYGFHWESAAPAILRWLDEADIRGGTAVDLGCGGGQWLAKLASHGFAPVGVDISPVMIRAARKLVPQAKLLCGSFADAKLPSCDVVTSLGEPLNYLPNSAQFRRTLKNVAAALRPGGLFIFDVRLRSSKPVAPRTAARMGDDWACIADIEEDTAGRLTREITTFRRHGRSYHRSQETHRLQLYSSTEITAWLRALRFRVRTRKHYGDYQLGPRQAVFVAKKRA